MPHIVEELSQAILDWRENHDGLPVLTWMAFVEKTRHYINPLVSEDIMVQAVSAIHDMGEVREGKDGEKGERKGEEWDWEGRDGARRGGVGLGGEVRGERRWGSLSICEVESRPSSLVGKRHQLRISQQM